MTFAAAISTCFKKYADFRGKASRSEYWYFMLFTVLIAIVTSTIDGVTFGTGLDNPSPFSDIASVALLLPQITAMVRRVRDAGFSAKWFLLLLAPVVVAVATIAANLSFFTEQVAATATSDQIIMQLLTVLLPVILVALAVNTFFLVLTLKKSKQTSMAEAEYSAGAD